MLSGKRILLGVTGGIAAYKAAFLLRAFQKEGAEVRVTMTPSATRFVGTETFASLSKNDVAIDIFPESGTASQTWTRHIDWGEWADLFVIAPCTANTLSKIAHGAADNMLTSTVLAARCPLLLCPTMDGGMYEAPATVQNLERVHEYGYHVLEPGEGYLASGQEGTGRLPEIETILNKVAAILSKKKAKGPLSGKKVLVTAGPTREHIDPVRFISNPSSGKMGFAMAEAARDLGGEVTLIHGKVSLNKPKEVKTVEINSAEELFNEVKKHAAHDIIIMAAAVSDYRPEKYHEQKVKKSGAEQRLKLTKTTDILAWLGTQKKNGQILVGFAMETQNLLDNAGEKLKKKNLDWIAANALNNKGSGFETDTNTIYLLGKNEEEAVKLAGRKTDVARQILQTIFPSDQ